MKAGVRDFDKMQPNLEFHVIHRVVDCFDHGTRQLVTMELATILYALSIHPKETDSFSSFLPIC